jgi:fatty acid-binding protein DegV
MEYLRRGGRVRLAQALLGDLLDAHPILTIRDGEVAPVETVRPRSRAMLRLRELALEHEPLHEAILCGSGFASMAQFEALLQERYRGPLQQTWLGPTLGANAGPLLAVAAVTRP